MFTYRISIRPSPYTKTVLFSHRYDSTQTPLVQGYIPKEHVYFFSFWIDNLKHNPLWKWKLTVCNAGRFAPSLELNRWMMVNEIIWKNILAIFVCEIIFSDIGETIAKRWALCTVWSWNDDKRDPFCWVVIRIIVWV